MPDTERFQSTPSLRRATAIIIEGPLRLQVSIHALLAESDSQRHGLRFSQRVSIHALLAESDTTANPPRIGPIRFNPRPPCGERHSAYFFGVTAMLFQSTPSLRRATNKGMAKDFVETVSIHALLAESDTSWCWPRPTAHCFNPRPPCGERLGRRNFYVAFAGFQSTPSLRRATG